MSFLLRGICFCPSTASDRSKQLRQACGKAFAPNLVPTGARGHELQPKILRGNFVYRARYQIMTPDMKTDIVILSPHMYHKDVKNDSTAFLY